MEKSNKDYIYVGLQFVLFAVFFLPFFKRFELPQFTSFIGLVLFIVGCLVTLGGLIKLANNLSPYPTPKDEAFLETGGLYKYMRHPIYSGLIMAFGGIAGLTLSGYKLIITVLIYVLFYYKSSYEEEKLMKRYPSYSEYRDRTNRFFPSPFKK